MTFDEITKLLENNNWGRRNQGFWNSDALWEYHKHPHTIHIDRIDQIVGVFAFDGFMYNKVHRWTSDKSIIATVKKYSKGK